MSLNDQKIKFVLKNFELSENEEPGRMGAGVPEISTGHRDGNGAGDDTMSVFVCDIIVISEAAVTALIVRRLYITGNVDGECGTLVSIEEYRELVGDYASTDKLVVARLQYLEAFCKNIINPELKKYVLDQQ